ncbi:MAG: hypothetical protein AB8C46_07945 [Burkholderiaceae bacterium]
MSFTDGDARVYLVRQADRPLELVTVADDGKNTYIEFGFHVPEAVRIFNSEGIALTHLRSNRTVVVAGIHNGLLTQIGPAQAYVELAPASTAGWATELVETDDVVKLRNTIDQHHALAQPMARATIASTPHLVRTRSELLLAGLPTTAIGQVEIDWDQPVPSGATASWVDDASPGSETYVTFAPGSLNPLAAKQIVERLAEQAKSETGVLVLRGIALEDSDEQAVSTASQRAEILADTLASMGVPSDRLVVARLRREPAVSTTDPSTQTADAVEISFLEKQ